MQSALVAPSSAVPTAKISDGKVLCTFCKLKCAIYTCPRCAFQSCSLACSSGHKETTNCAQVRDKAAYVPMNQYGLGTLANDYGYLEEVGRKVSEWGRDIGQNGYMDASARSSSRGRARGRGRGPARGRGGISRQAGRNHRREILRSKLEDEDIEMLLLPEGMERRRLNQSTWDLKQRKAFLSVEFVFRRGSHSLNGSRVAGSLTYSVVAHRYGLDTQVTGIIRTCVAERNKKDPLPDWIYGLLPPGTSTEEKQSDGETVLLLSEPPSRPREPRQYHVLDQSRTLGELLKGRSFVEFPTVEVMSRADHDAVACDVVDSTAALRAYDASHDGSESESEDETRHGKKRRKLDPSVGKQLLSGLMVYGSDTGGSDDELARLRTGDGRADKPSVLDALGDYESDEVQSSEEGDIEAEAEGPFVTGSERPPGTDLTAAQRRSVVTVDDHQDVDDEVDWGGSDSDM